MSEFYYTIFNALLYFIPLYWSLKTRRYIITLISIIWLLCSIIGIFYYLNPFRIMFYPLMIKPFLYLYVLFLTSILPFVGYNKTRLEECRYGVNFKLFSFLISLLAFCSFEPTIETIVTIITRGASNLSKAYDSGVDPRAYFSFVGKYLFSIVDYFKFVTPILFFIYLSIKSVRKKWKTVGLVLAVSLPMLNNLANGQRFYVVLLTYSLIYNYLFFYHKIDVKTKMKLRKYSLIGGAGVLFLFVAISIARFGNNSSYSSEYGASYQVIRYMGESMINFNTETFHIKKFLGGHNSFTGFYSYFLHEDRDIDAQNDIIGVTTNVFSTYIGNFVMDYGLVVTAIIIVITSIIMLVFVRRQNRILGVNYLIILYLYANILLFGTTYFIYQNGFIHMLFAIMIAMFFKFSKKDIYV